MKKLALLFVTVMMVFQSYSQSSPKNKINVYQKPDQVLSPFEDMTEYALNNNSVGITKAMTRINMTQKNQVFRQVRAENNYIVFEQKIKSLQQFVAQHYYKKTALISAELFKFNISHFIYANQLKRQLLIEHMDYMGYQVLALLKQDKIDWKNIAKATDSLYNRFSGTDPGFGYSFYAVPGFLAQFQKFPAKHY